MSVEIQLAQRFVCSKCRRTGGKAKRFAATGTGLTKLFDIQHQRFIAVSCNYCGYTEVCDPEPLEGRSHLGDVLDILFGG